MKIQISDKKVSVSVTGISERIEPSELNSIASKMHDIIKAVNAYGNKSDCVQSPIKATPDTLDLVNKALSKEPAPVTAKQESPLIRPRIPNNIVDVKDLTIEKAVTENALVRCPSCGQAHCLVVPTGNRFYMMRRDFKDNEFGIIAEFDSLNQKEFINMCCPDESVRQAYYHDLQCIPFQYNTDFAVNNDTEIFCPVCCKSSTFNFWKEAFEHPLEYFETEHLCDACGGEKLEKVVKGKKLQYCDACGLETPCKED